MTFAPPPRPYPAPRHEGDEPTTAGSWRRAGGEHDIEFDNGGWVDYLVTGTQSDGDFGLYRWHMAGPVSGPDPHFHRTMSESFFVVRGEVDIYDGLGWQTSRPGDFLYVPPGGAHGFRNNSGEPAELLLLFSPGAPREAYFEGLASLATASPGPTPEEMDAFYLAHDNIWLD